MEEMKMKKFWIPEETNNNSAEVAAAEEAIEAFELSHPGWEKVLRPRFAGKYLVAFYS